MSANQQQVTVNNPQNEDQMLMNEFERIIQPDPPTANQTQNDTTTANQTNIKPIEYIQNNKRLLISTSTRLKALSTKVQQIPIIGQFAIVINIFAFIVSFTEEDALTSLIMKTTEILFQYLIFINVINRCRVTCLTNIRCIYLDIADKIIKYYETVNNNNFELPVDDKTIEMFALNDEILDNNERNEVNHSEISNVRNQIVSDQSKIKKIKEYYNNLPDKLPNYEQIQHLFRIIAIDTSSFENDLMMFVRLLIDKFKEFTTKKNTTQSLIEFIKNNFKSVYIEAFKSTFRIELFNVIQQRLTIFNSKMTILQNKFTNLLIQLNYYNSIAAYNNFLLVLYKSEEYKLFISPVLINEDTLAKIINDSKNLKDEMKSNAIVVKETVLQSSAVAAGFLASHINKSHSYSLHGIYKLSEESGKYLDKCRTKNSISIINTLSDKTEPLHTIQNQHTIDNRNDAAPSQKFDNNNSTKIQTSDKRITQQNVNQNNAPNLQNNASNSGKKKNPSFFSMFFGSNKSGGKTVHKRKINKRKTKNKKRVKRRNTKSRK